MRAEAKIISIIFLLFCGNAISQLSDKYQIEIDQLTALINNSECTFNRNGTDYPGHRVIKHINNKYAYFKKDISTTEHFIALTSTKSEISGKKYTVRCDGSETQELGTWLIKELKKIRNSH